MVASNTGVPRVWRMARSLTKAGLSVTILEWDRGVKATGVMDVDGIKLVRFSRRSSFGSKAAVWFPFWLVHTAVFALKNRFSVLQLQNFDNLVLPLALRTITRSKIVYDLADFYADAYLPNSGLLTKFIRYLERRAIRQVDAMIIVSEGQLKQTGIQNLPGCRHLIYNTLMDDEIQSFAPSEEDSRNSKGISLFYAGVLSKDRLQSLLNLISALEDFEDITLGIAGFGEREEIIKKKIGERANASYLGVLTRSEVMKYTTECDCIVIPYDSTSPCNSLSLPNKFFDALAEAKAVLVSKNTWAGSIAEGEQCGLTTDFADIEDIKRSLRWMREHRDELSRMGMTGKELFDHRYNWSLMEERLADLYAYVVGK